MLASNGEIEPPCGVPFSPSCPRPSSRTPAFNHACISLSTRLSPIRRLRKRMSHSWLKLPKKSRISTSRTLPLPPVQNFVDRRQCVMTTQPWSETERALQKILLVNFIQNLRHRRLNRTINHRRHGQRELHLRTTRIWDGLRSVTLSTPFGASAST